MFRTTSGKSRTWSYRRLWCEPLEDRRLLSVAAGHAAAADISLAAAGQVAVESGSAMISASLPAQDTLVKAAAQVGEAVSPMVAPSISSVVAAPAQGVITWNVVSANGVTSTTLSVDGTPVSQILGPFQNPSGGVNFSGQIGSRTAGTHSFVITAIDSFSNSSQFTGSFDVTSVGPTISSVVTVPSQGIITWNVQSPGTVTTTTLTVDGNPIAQVSGPFTNPGGGVNFSGFFGSAATGTHSFTITAADSFGNTGQFTGTFNILSVGPTIGSVVVVPAQGLITWNAQAASGVASSTLTVDGTLVTRIVGPMQSAIGGVNFAGLFGSLLTGGHTFAITATDNLGNTSQSTGSFIVQSTGPTISSVVPVPAQGIITWNVQSAATLASNTLVVDGIPVAQISGPFNSPTGGVNFSGFFGALGTGGHTFSITATDSSGNSSQSTGTFSVISTGPTISAVTVVPAQGVITWNAQSPNGVASSTLSVDGTPANVFGPMVSPSGGVNFTGFFGSKTVGTHTYTITATDNLGRPSQSTGTFIVSNVGPTISQIAIVPAQGLMTWNAQAPSGVAASSLTIDGAPVADILGPFTSTTGGVNFAGIFGALGTGKHTFSIFSTDNQGNSSQSTGTFIV